MQGLQTITQRGECGLRTWLQHARHLFGGCAAHRGRELVEEVDAGHLQPAQIIMTCALCSARQSSTTGMPLAMLGSDTRLWS